MHGERVLEIQNRILDFVVVVLSSIPANVMVNATPRGYLQLIMIASAERGGVWEVLRACALRALVDRLPPSSVFRVTLPS